MASPAVNISTPPPAYLPQLCAVLFTTQFTGQTIHVNNITDRYSNTKDNYHIQLTEITTITKYSYDFSDYTDLS